MPVQDCSSLDLRDNALTSIAELGSHACLQRLYLGRNVVRDLAPVLSLKRLEVLDLSDNKMQSLTGLDSLPALRALNLAGEKPLQAVEWQMVKGDTVTCQSCSHRGMHAYFTANIVPTCCAQSYRLRCVARLNKKHQ